MALARAAQPAHLALARGREAQQRLLGTDFWRDARSLALYVGIGDEMPTDMLLRAAWDEGRQVWLPRVLSAGPGMMDFVCCSGPECLVPGPFGLRQPRASLPGADSAGFAPDCMVLPGLAFDRAGGRLGYGGGYYDRFVRDETHCLRVGLCFDFQLVESLPLDPWDRRVHCLCTEERLLCP